MKFVKHTLTALALGISLAACTPTMHSPQTTTTQTAMLKNTPTYADLAYTQSERADQKLDIYLPPHAKGNVPTVIYIHGGGWLMGDKSTAAFDDYSQSHLLFKRLLDNGFAVVSVNYRLSDQAVYPAQEQDVAAAVKFVQQNSKKYGLDVNRFALLGDSAGGQLAEITALKFGNPQIKAAVSFYGEADMQHIAADRQALNCPDVTGVMQQFVRYELNGQPEEIVLNGKFGSRQYQRNAKAASPVANVSKNAPPFLLLHGKPDCIVPAVQAERFKQQLDKQGIANELVLLDNAEHAAAEFYTTESVQEKVLAFLRKYL